MEADKFTDIAQHALWVLALGSAPLLIPTLIIGVLLGMVQAATSINEATLTFVPKLIVFGVCMVLFGGAIMGLLTDFTLTVFQQIPEIVR
jgi:flagellar biosynthetic protein FliQ